MAFLQLHGLVPAGTTRQTSVPEHEILPCGQFSALISRLAPNASTTAPSPDELAAMAMQHNALLVAYCAETTVVPMAIGAVFSDISAVTAALEIDMDQHLRALNALHKTQEFTVHLRITQPQHIETRSPNSGRHYLQMQRQKRNERNSLNSDRQTLAHDIRSRLEPICTQIQRASAQNSDDMLNCVILARKSKIPELRALAHRFHDPAERLGLDFVITGPWPPYSSAVLTQAKGEVCDVVGA